MSVRLAGVFVAVLALSGCLHVSSVIRVAADGTGTIEQTLLFGAKNFEEAFAGLGLKSTPGSSSSAPSERAPFDADSVATAAGALGEGVRLVSVVPVRRADGFEGLRVKMAFADVTTLRTADLLLPDAARDDMPGGGPADAARFALARTPRGTTELVVTFEERPRAPKATGEPAPKAAPDFADPEGQAMARSLFRGFLVGLDLEVVGQIERAKADHRVGNRFTLLELNLGALASSSASIDSLNTALGDNVSIAKLGQHLRGVKGITVNRPRMVIEFR